MLLRNKCHRENGVTTSSTDFKSLDIKKKRKYTYRMKGKKPGDPGRKKGFVIGPDGKTEMAQYAYVRLLKIKRNDERMRRLGLMKGIILKKEQEQKTILIKKRDKQPKQHNKPCSPILRRSSRRSLGPVEYDGSEIDSIDFFQKNKSPSTNRAKRTYRHDLRTPTEDERSHLSKIPAEEWMQDMAYFMHHVLENSDANVKQTMEKIRLLAEGKGILHPRSDLEGNVYRKGEAITLGDNFETTYTEATEWVDAHGGDRGHGWLVQHPLKKIWRYQVERLEKGGTPFSK